MSQTKAQLINAKSATVEFTAGSASTPAVTFTSDLNTGLYSPGADQVAISTGGTGRLFVASDGKVGIGAASPSAQLDVRQNQANYSYFDFYNTTAGGGVVWRQIVRNIADTGTTSIDFVKYLSGGFAIANNDTNAANFTAFNVGASERLRITSDGKVGIGTSTPVAKLDITETGTNSCIVRVKNDSSSVYLDANNGYAYLNAFSNTPLLFGTNNLERLRITADGKVGIGTVSPLAGAKLDVTGGAVVCDRYFHNRISSSLAVAERGLLFNTDGTDYGRIYSPNGKSVAIQAGAGTLTDAVTVDQLGKVGIGTSSPVYLLDVQGTARIGAPTGDAQLEIGVDATANRTAYIDLVGDTTYTDYGLRIQRGDQGANADSIITQRGTGVLYFQTQEAAPIVFRTASQDRVKITSDGKVGIGTSSPATVLETSVASGQNEFRQGVGGATRGQLISTDTDQYIVSAGSGGQTFWNGGSERMRITSDGKVGIGTSSPALETKMSIVDAASAGIYLLRSGQGETVIENTGSLTIRQSSGNGANQNIFFKTGASVGTEVTAMTITGSQKVGIGTSSPAERLTVNNGIIIVESTGGTSDSRIQFQQDTGFFSWIGQPTWDKASIYIYGPTAGGSEVAAKYGSSTWTFSTGGTEKARIDSSGRLLVGTSTVANNLRLEQSLAVVRTGSGYGGMSLTSYVGTAAGTCPVLDFQRSRGTTDGSLTKVQSGDRLGVIAFRGANGTTFSDGALIDCWADDEWNTSGDTSDSPGRLSFWTTPNGSEVPAERMRITSGGFVKVSNTGTYTGESQNYHEILSDQGGGLTTLIVSSSSATAQSIQSELNSDGTTYSYFKGYSVSGGAYRIIIYSNGNVVNTNNSYGAISDIKLKENIVDANSQWDDIKALQVRNYNFKEGQTHTQIGLVAQEAELVSPGLITESPDRDKDGNDLGTVTKSVNYSVLYMKAVKALQEAMERIEQLEAEMAEVKAQLS